MSVVSFQIDTLCLCNTHTIYRSDIGAPREGCHFWNPLSLEILKCSQSDQYFLAALSAGRVGTNENAKVFAKKPDTTLIGEGRVWLRR